MFHVCWKMQESWPDFLLKKLGHSLHGSSQKGNFKPSPPALLCQTALFPSFVFSIICKTRKTFNPQQTLGIPYPKKPMKRVSLEGMIETDQKISVWLLLLKELSKFIYFETIMIWSIFALKQQEFCVATRSRGDKIMDGKSGTIGSIGRSR